MKETLELINQMQADGAGIWRRRMGKQEMRKDLAALSFSEKVKILERLRKRSLAFAEAREKRKTEMEDPRETSKEAASGRNIPALVAPGQMHRSFAPLRMTI